jgi:protein-tyrosine-phosphatase/DNA-binding transcriptional ArsR family regulator
LQLVADPHRWQLLQLLGQSDRRVGELAELLGKAQNVVSYHLGELRAAGLVSSRRSSADGRDTYYRIELARCGANFAAAGLALHPGLRLELAADTPDSPGRRRPRVLFLCTGNSARSQIAEALLVQRSGGEIEAKSAGSHPKPLHPAAVQVLAERGIDITGRPTKHLGQFARTRFDRVITLCDKVREVCPEFPGQPVTAHWSIPDPATAAGPGEDPYPIFERTADDIEMRVDQLLAQLAHRPTEESIHAHR